MVSIVDPAVRNKEASGSGAGLNRSIVNIASHGRLDPRAALCSALGCARVTARLPPSNSFVHPRIGVFPFRSGENKNIHVAPAHARAFPAVTGR